MKTLLILRHAKSSWDNLQMSDFERPLNARGLEAAPFIGKIIYDKKLQPDLVLSSPAKRAKQTAILIKQSAQISANIKYEQKIYEASPLILVEIISEIDDNFALILLVGHNPGLESLVRILAGQLQPMPTAALAKINLNIEKWADIKADCGNLEFLITPKNEINKLTT